MKKFFSIIACAILGVAASTQVSAQNPTFGAKVGFDLTNFVGHNAEHSIKPGYQAGVFMEYKFAGSNFAIAPEVVFAAQGAKSENVEYTTNYINVPVILKYYVTPNFAIDFGPQVGFNVYSKVTAEASNIKVKTDLKDYTNTVDFGLGLGGTYNLAENVFLQARYTLGLTKVFDDEKLLGTSYNKAKNQNIQIAIGYKF